MKRLPLFNEILWLVVATDFARSLLAAEQENPVQLFDPAPIINPAGEFKGGSLSASSEPASVAEQAPVPTKVVLSKAETGLKIKIGENESVSVRDLSIAAVHNGITVEQRNGGIVLQAGDQPARLETDLIKDWQVEIPKKNSLQLNVNPDKGWFDLRTPETNNEKVKFVFPDEGRVEMGPKSTGRYDYYLDQTYCFSARGQVEGESADGLKMKFSANMPPMLGGALQERINEKGEKKMHRATPAVSVIVGGDPNQSLVVRVEEQQYDLTPGETKIIATKNGGEFSFRHNLDRSTLDWSIAKGVARMTLGGIDCWKSFGLSEQSGVSQWAGPMNIIDLRNKTGTDRFEPVQTVLVQINGRIFASAAPAATFSYAKMRDCGSFATSAYGGEVMLYNMDTRELTSLAQNNLLFEAGSPFKPNTPASLKEGTALRLTWESDTSVCLRGGSSTIEVKSNTKDTLVVGENELEVNYQNNGDLNLRAKIGGFQIKPDFVEDFAIVIPQGGSVSLNLQRKNFIFTVKEGVDNEAGIGVATLSGFSSKVAGNEKVTLVLGQHNFLEAGAANGNATWMFFNGNAGMTSFGMLDRNTAGNPTLTRPPIVDLRTTTEIDRLPLNVVSGQ